MCSVLRCDRVTLYLNFDRPLEQDELSNFKKRLLRRASREPLQYIVGETEFFSLRFQVGPGVLIPRPETEVLVERAISYLSLSNQKSNVLDVGTGSGIIAISIAKHCPAAHLLAIDISDTALQVAAENSKLHNTSERIELIQCNILNEQDWHLLGDVKFDVIVSNPPYIASSERNTLEPEVRQYEPAEALFVEEPLLFYRVLGQLAKRFLSKQGQLLCEIAANRHAAIASLFGEMALQKIEVLPDLTGKMRVITATIP